MIASAEQDRKDRMVLKRIFICIVVFIVGAIAFGMFVVPVYSVWQQGMSGKAKLREAEYSRQILIQEANAKKESSILLASAEVERAKGVAQANEIIGSSLKGNEAYLRYLWIMGLQDGNSEVIYVPTEGQLPILEAGRFNK